VRVCAYVCVCVSAYARLCVYMCVGALVPAHVCVCGCVSARGKLAFHKHENGVKRKGQKRVNYGPKQCEPPLLLPPLATIAGAVLGGFRV